MKADFAGDEDKFNGTSAIIASTAGVLRACQKDLHYLTIAT